MPEESIHGVQIYVPAHGLSHETVLRSSPKVKHCGDMLPGRVWISCGGWELDELHGTWATLERNVECGVPQGRPDAARRQLPRVQAPRLFVLTRQL